MAVCQELEVKNDLIPRIATAFAGGMGRSGDVCGSVVGAVMCIGVKHGREEPGQWQRDDTANALTQRFLRSFRDEMAPVPRVTAYDLLDRISRKMPAADKVAIDVQDLDIKAKKTSIKGTGDSAAALDEVVAKLKEIDCFEEINKGPLTEVSGGAKQFSLTINSKCP